MDVPFADQILRRYAGLLHRHGKKVAPISTLSGDTVRRVLLVLTTGLGDAILSTPVFSNLRRALPSADIRLFCRSPWVSLFKHDPDLDGVIRYYGKYCRFFSTLAALRDFAPDLTLVLHGNDPDIIPMMYIAGSRYIVRGKWASTRYRFLLSNGDRDADREIAPDLHYIENRLRILHTIGISAQERFPRIYVPQAARMQACRILSELSPAVSRYWVYHAFAADMYKVWPLNKGRALIQEALDSFPEISVVLTGTNKERPALAKLVKGLPGDRVINVAGKMDILQTAACLQGAQCVVAPDTGVIHLAAALDVPLVGLYAATSAAAVGPRPRHKAHRIIQKQATCTPCINKKCAYVPENCMNQITVAEVENALRECIRHSGLSHTRPLLAKKNGGGEGIRTPDPNVANVVLSQLSYTPIYFFIHTAAKIENSYRRIIGTASKI